MFYWTFVFASSHLKPRLYNIPSELILYLRPWCAANNEFNSGVKFSNFFKFLYDRAIFDETSAPEMRESNLRSGILFSRNCLIIG